jgi:gluconolactonase
MTPRRRTCLRAAFVLGLLAGLLDVPGARTMAGDGEPAAVLRVDPRFDRLVPAGARLEKIADGFAWVEGPVWDRRRAALLFSDIPANTVLVWRERTGAEVFLRPSGYTGTTPFAGREPGSNGLAFDTAGRLVLCEHGDRRIARLETDGRKTTLADRYDGKRLNSPNDLIFAANGDLYFTDPPFGLPRAFDDPAREIDFSGVYRLSAPGELTLLTRDIRAPNGIALAPSGRLLYVSSADRDRPVVLAFDLGEDGTLSPGRVFFDATPWVGARRGLPDGMKVDREGNLFAAGPGGVYVLAPDGTHLGTIETGGATSNCAWGEDGATLYVTAGRAVYRIRLATKGPGF